MHAIFVTQLVTVPDCWRQIDSAPRACWLKIKSVCLQREQSLPVYLDGLLGIEHGITNASQATE